MLLCLNITLNCVSATVEKSNEAENSTNWERRRMLLITFEREAIVCETVEWKLFNSLFDLGILMSLICISDLHLENSNINTRNKFKVTNLLQQCTGVINLYNLSSRWISYHERNKVKETPQLQTKQDCSFASNLSCLICHTKKNLLLLSIYLGSTIFSQKNV